MYVADFKLVNFRSTVTPCPQISHLSYSLITYRTSNCRSRELVNMPPTFHIKPILRDLHWLPCQQCQDHQDHRPHVETYPLHWSCNLYIYSNSASSGYVSGRPWFFLQTSFFESEAYITQKDEQMENGNQSVKTHYCRGIINTNIKCLFTSLHRYNGTSSIRYVNYY